MSIHLYVEPYCEECRCFEPDVVKIVIGSFDDTLHRTEIRCVSREECKRKMEYLKQEIEKEKQNEQT